MSDKNPWFTQAISGVLGYFQSNERGLTQTEAQKRLEKYGFNKLPETKTDGWLIIFIRQFQNPLIYILLLASVIVFLMDEIIDSLIILAVLCFNSIMGTIQEGKAQNTLLALKKFTEATATVLRDNQEFIISDHEVVPGDIIIVQEGEKIPADARIISADNLKVDESMLTGESVPVSKTAERLTSDNLSPAEQKNMLFKGSNVVAGSARAVIVATGMETIVGQISKEIIAIDTDIPLKKDIKILSRIIVAIVAVISVTLFVSGIFLGEPLVRMFTVVVSLAVSIVPVGLPVVITLVLATGVWRMSRQQALVKKLQAVEALGQAKIIAVDKTGTLTKNEMMAKKVYAGRKFFEIGGVGYEPKGEFKLNDELIDPLNHPELLLAGKIASFCSNARLSFDQDSGDWRVAGDPTEAAGLIFSEKIGFHKNELENESPRLVDLPFDSQLKYHASIHKEEDKNLLSIVGAPEKVLSLTSGLWVENKSRKLNSEDIQEIEKALSQLTSEGLRVVALAVKWLPRTDLNIDNLEDLIFVGFLGIIDALRPEAYEAVTRAKEAGIKVVMITGDHQETAQAIAKEVGIYEKGDIVLSGTEIDSWSEERLAGELKGVSVFARVTPGHKLKIVNAYRCRGEIIAMTGDGVNDAPSLVAADLGVAMGKIGTEVAKEAADIVLLDDNFGSIISAVEEGRSIYKTIKKVVLYLFSTSSGEVLIIAGALFLDLPLPLLAAQIIWLNFVTDGFLDVALGMEPKEEGLLKEKQTTGKRYLMDKEMFQRMIFMAIPMTVGTLLVFSRYFEADMVKAWTMSLTVMAAFQWFNVWNCRSNVKSIFQLSFWSNKFLLGATIVVVVLQLFAIYHPLFQSFLRTSPLTLIDWVYVLLTALSIIVVEELRKLIVRWRQPVTA